MMRKSPGNIRLALRAVDDEIIGVSLPDIEFGKGGERRAAHADDARFRNAAEHAFPVKGRKGRQTLFLLGKIVLDKDMIAFLARERDMGNDALDRARDGRKDGADNPCPAFAMSVPFFTFCPASTTGTAGAPICWLSGIYTFSESAPARSPRLGSGIWNPAGYTPF